HLTALLAPRHLELTRAGFDRRFWWAQLHRALTTRARVALSEQERQALDQALERLAEGDFEMCWRGLMVTIWTDQLSAQSQHASLPLPTGQLEPAFTPPDGFAIDHVTLGYEGLCALFATPERPAPLFIPQGPGILVRPLEAIHPQPLLTAMPHAPRAPDEDDDEVQTHPLLLATGIPEAVSAPDDDGGKELTPSLILTAPALQQPAFQPAQRLPSQSHTASEDMPHRPDETSHQRPERLAPEALASADSSAQAPRVLSASFPVPERLLIGARPNGEPLYWHFGHEKLNNRHLLIFGASGSGKTYGIQCLLAELARERVRSIIVDYTDGFLPAQMESRFIAAVRTKSHFVRHEQLPLNPFRRQRRRLDPSVPDLVDSPYDVATRVMSIFTSVFNDMGSQQRGALSRALEKAIETDPDLTLETMLDWVRAEGQHGETLADKIEPFIRARPFRIGDESPWDSLLQTPDQGVHVLQLSGLAREIQRLVTEFVLWDLWDYAQSSGSKNRPIPIVLDEVQNLDHSDDSPIDKMLREGRKFGLAMILATQTTSQFNAEQRDRLFQAGHKLFFKPATSEIDRFATLLSQATPGMSKADWAQRLNSLEKGECWSLGPVLKSAGSFKEEAVKVKITSLAERGFFLDDER
ncbi:MAG: type IV secretion system DNA-binding domain-containing protein, partial [Chromatiaceae bacterium]|nr:type IV secretion system DNA-binding domain-containing protein [Chromatiaceae bacterium]